MTKLSPAAQSVSNAAKASLDWEAGYLPNAVAAAALRAAADGCSSDWMGLTVIHHLYALADELVGK